LDLFDEIETDKCSYTVQLDKIEINLEKKNKGKGWTTLERPDADNEVILETKTP